MIGLPAMYRPIFGDEIVLKSIDWLENFPWGNENTTRDQKDKYDVYLNVKDFAAKEIQIKISDKLLVIEAKHDERKDDYGYISRHFVRKYRLPEDCILEEIQSRLSPEGMLVVTAPKRPVLNQDTIIPVSQETKEKGISKL